ncbi:hypothetical protein EPI10_024498 [Gossypium australe]|uniref:Reverse transcriptase n=1 Tax=Gossypium australe TaxID=47621 RepID=A0A5B6VX43_9ROSI|nr:hypothetical protein EPI10_024498 [Gossypium australe]
MIKEQIGDVLNPEKYLGLPTIIGRRKKEAFMSFKERFIKQIESWSVCHLLVGEKSKNVDSMIKERIGDVLKVSQAANYCWAKEERSIYEFQREIYKINRKLECSPFVSRGKRGIF